MRGSMSKPLTVASSLAVPPSQPYGPRCLAFDWSADFFGCRHWLGFWTGPTTGSLPFDRACRQCSVSGLHDFNDLALAQCVQEPHAKRQRQPLRFGRQANVDLNLVRDSRHAKNFCHGCVGRFWMLSRLRIHSIVCPLITNRGPIIDQSSSRAPNKENVNKLRAKFAFL